MKIKQTAIVILMILACLLTSAVATKPVFATDCAGVQTSIITCDGKNPPTQSCPSGKTMVYGTGTDSNICCTDTDVTSKSYCTDASAPLLTYPTNVSDTGLWGLLNQGLSILTAGIGVAAVGGIVYAGIIYSMSRAKPEQRKKAIIMISNVAVGLLLYGLIVAILQFIIPGGLF